MPRYPTGGRIEISTRYDMIDDRQVIHVDVPPMTRNVVIPRELLEDRRSPFARGVFDSRAMSEELTRRVEHAVDEFVYQLVEQRYWGPKRRAQDIRDRYGDMRRALDDRRVSIPAPSVNINVDSSSLVSGTVTAAQTAAATLDANSVRLRATPSNGTALQPPPAGRTFDIEQFEAEVKSATDATPKRRTRRLEDE